MLNPLFLDDLREKLAEAGDNARKLLNLRSRMARIRVFDPACGSGNFLNPAFRGAARSRSKLDPTFLMADVEIVATYKLFNVNRARLENVIHRIFDPARLDIEVKDRFGNLVIPREWFLVPLSVIDDAVAKIKDGTITSFVYDPSTARLTSA